MKQADIPKKVKKARVIPGYRCTLGIVVTMLSLIVLIPLASVLVHSLQISPREFFALLWKPNVRNAFLTSIGCSFVAAVLNAVFGLIVAWTLVKYDFPGKRILDGFIELPFALPTAVAGITLSKLYSESGWLGSGLGKIGIKVKGSETIARYIRLLFHFGEFSGVGIKTGMGMGAIRCGVYAWRDIEKDVLFRHFTGITTGSADRVWPCFCQRNWRIRQCHLHFGKQRKGKDTGNFLCYYAKIKLY